MPALIFIWYMITTPADLIRCTLWANEPPRQQQLLDACGFNDLTHYRLDVVSLETGEIVCTQPGNSLGWVREDCGLKGRLDDFQVRIVEPGHTEPICSIAIDHEGPPMRSEIQDACGVDVLLRQDAGTVTAKFVSSQPKPPAQPARVCELPALAVGIGLYEQSPSAADLYTDQQFTLLAGRLIWYGMIRPECAGGRSGLDPITLAADACGMAASRSAVIAWQNQFNPDIYAAAVKYDVPARLLKRIIEIESQYWPAWKSDHGETGMLQVSENGADVLLRYDPDLDREYPHRPIEQQYWRRMDVLRVLACAGCSITRAVDQMHVTIPIYARLLAAYRCRAVEITPALSGAEAWRQAAADYNGSQDYLRKVEG